jgi:Domain of unknown function (DUF4402)
MRSNFLRAILLASTVAATVTGVSTANAATATATATATIVQAISIVQAPGGGLNFASIAPSAAGGDVTVDTADTRTACTGGQFCSGTVTSGAFNVAGANNYNYTLTLPTTAVTLTRVSGTETMSVGTFAHNAGLTPALSATGTSSFKVGATLTVGANQVAGVYNGTFPVTVVYN